MQPHNPRSIGLMEFGVFGQSNLENKLRDFFTLHLSFSIILVLLQLDYRIQCATNNIKNVSQYPLFNYIIGLFSTTKKPYY